MDEGATLIRILLAAGCCALITLAACTYYAVPVAGTVVTTPANYDRSFAAAAGAMRDEGLALTVEDPANGIVVGRLGGSTVTTRVQRQSDGSVQVRFDSSDTHDQTLLQRISRSYDRRMGR
jgi:bifunctional ADP-heptose synthase (sugar kinase/adenylyltransferase)